MFKKKSFASAALVGALLFGGTFPAAASAEEGQSYSAGNYTYKVYYSVNSFCDNLSNSSLQDFLKKNFPDYEFNWSDLEQDETNKHEPKQPVEEKEEPQTKQPTEDKQKEESQQQEGQQKPDEVQPPAETPAPAPSEPKQPKQEQQQPAEEQGYQLNQFEQQVVALTNQERTERGLAPLKVSLELSKVARTKSKDMAQNNYFSHNSPTYGSPFEMMRQFGISYRTAGENIAMGQRTPKQVVNAWMNSPGHRKNILNPDFTHIGVGYVSNGHYWTQQFIGK